MRFCRSSSNSLICLTSLLQLAKQNWPLPVWEATWKDAMWIKEWQSASKIPHLAARSRSVLQGMRIARPAMALEPSLSRPRPNAKFVVAQVTLCIAKTLHIWWWSSATNAMVWDSRYLPVTLARVLDLYALKSLKQSRFRQACSQTQSYALQAKAIKWRKEWGKRVIWSSKFLSRKTQNLLAIKTISSLKTPYHSLGLL